MSSLDQVFSGEAPVTLSSEVKAESDFSGSIGLSYSTASYSTASTQTPAEFVLPQDDLQMGNSKTSL